MAGGLVGANEGAFHLDARFEFGHQGQVPRIVGMLVDGDQICAGHHEDDITFAQPDFSFPETRDWLVEQLTTQLINYGVGMKFDPQERKQLSCQDSWYMVRDALDLPGAFEHVVGILTGNIAVDH